MPEDNTAQPVPVVARPTQTTINASISSVPLQQTSGIGKDPAVAAILADVTDCVRRQADFFAQGDNASAAAVTQQIASAHANLVAILGG